MRKEFLVFIGFLVSVLIFVPEILLAAIEMNKLEKGLFKGEMHYDAMSEFYLWENFYYQDDSEYKNPHDRDNGDQSNKDHETQGITNIHEIDENGTIVSEYWVLIKNNYIDVFKLNASHFFEEYEKVNLFENSGEKFGHGDFYYSGFFGLGKTLAVPGNDKVYFFYGDIYKDQKHYSVNNRVDYDGISEIKFNDKKSWSYLTIFPKTGMIFKPCQSIVEIEGNNLTENSSEEKVFARRVKVRMESLKRSNDGTYDLEKSDINQSNYTNWIQGGAFSPNGRFFYNVHDAKQNNSGFTGVYIYYVPEKAYKDLIRMEEWHPNDQADIEFYMIGFIHIMEEMIPEDPLCAAERNIELEGINIFPALNGSEEYDIHLLVLNNRCTASTEQHSVYHYKSRDYDGDGIKDVYDNCPFDWNEDQADGDGNGLGDVCDHYDPDGDNVFEDDNCPGIYNPDQGDYDGDGVGDLCDPCPSNGMVFEYETRRDSDGDRIHDECDNCPNVKNKFVAASLNNELISAEIQECDEDDNWLECWLKLSFSGGASKNQERKNDGYLGNLIYENIVYKNRKMWYWQPDHDLDGIGDACDTDHSSVTKMISTTSPNLIFHKMKSEVNRFVDLNYKVIGDTTPGSTAKYCWMDLELMDEWGKGGYCTTSDLGKSIPTTNDSSFGYSHGGDPEPYNRQLNKLAWQTPKISSFMGKLSVVNKTKYSKSAIEKWDWTKNLSVDYPFLYETYVSSGQQNLKEPFINYAASVGSAGTENCSADEDYYDEEAEFINPACFRNFYINARTKRENKQGTKLSYYTENLRQNFFPFKITSEMLNSSEKSNSTCSGCVKFSDAVSSVTELWIYKDNILKSEKRKLNNADNIIATFNDEGNIISVFEGENEIYFGINDEDNPSEIILAGIAPKPQEDLIKGKGAVAKGRIFLTSANMLYSLEKDDSGQQTNIGSGMTYRFREIMQMPYPENEINVFSAGRELVMLRNNGQYYEPYILSGDTFIEIESDEYPASRDSFSFSSDNWKMYVAGGVTDGREGVAVHSDVWALDTAYGWRKIADSINIDMGDVLIKEENGILNIFSRTFPQKEVATAFINIATGETDYGKTVLESEFEAMDIEKYCISRKNDNTYPGKEFRNICSPAEDYQYKSYTFLDYKFSLAGIDDFVFSGGLSGIRTFRINAAGGLENGDLDVVGTVNSIAVKDNALYSSRSNKVFVFEVKENGDLVKRKEISTSGCDQIRVSGNMLFTGENGKVNIYDITDPFNPVKKQTVSLSMNVVDLEVWNEYLFVFHDKWFSSSKLAMFRFSDEGTIVKTDEVKLSCSDPEFMSDSQNVYLGCKNGQKKIEFNESEKLVIKSIGGSKNYFRDTYLRNGIIYTVHSGRIFLSK